MEIRVRRAEAEDLDESSMDGQATRKRAVWMAPGGNGASIRCGRMPRRDWKPVRSTLRSWTDRSPAR